MCGLKKPYQTWGGGAVSELVKSGTMLIYLSLRSFLSILISVSCVNRVVYLYTWLLPDVTVMIEVTPLLELSSLHLYCPFAIMIPLQIVICQQRRCHNAIILKYMKPYIIKLSTMSNNSDEALILQNPWHTRHLYSTEWNDHAHACICTEHTDDQVLQPVSIFKKTGSIIIL